MAKTKFTPQVYFLTLDGYTPGRLVRRTRRLRDDVCSSLDRSALIAILPRPNCRPLSKQTLKAKKRVRFAIDLEIDDGQEVVCRKFEL